MPEQAVARANFEPTILAKLDKRTELSAGIAQEQANK